VQTIDYPKMQNPQGKAIEHGVILRIVSTNICGSDQHMCAVAPRRPRHRAGHEITGEIIEKGKDVEFLNVGDWCLCPSTWPAGDAEPAANAIPAYA